jgi:glucokinase
VAIDLGGSHATVAALEDRRIQTSTEISLDCLQGLAPALPLLANAVRDVISRAGLETRDVAGVVLSFCGLADVNTGRVVATNKKFDDAARLNLPEWCKAEFGLPFLIENDARMALLGESYAGAARGTDDVVMITLGTGIGGAAMMNGKLLRGKHLQGGCLGGHLPVLFTGRECTCGAIGCAEAEASGWSLPLIAKEWPGFAESELAAAEQINFQTLFESAARGDKVAAAIRGRCLRVWGAVVVGLIHAYDPERAVIGGGVMRSAALIIPAIQDYVDKHAWTPWGTVRVAAAELGNNAGLLGAIPLLASELSS